MAIADDESDKTARSFIESKRLDRIADYIARGRVFRHLADDAVENGWRTSMKTMSLSPTERVHRNLNNDYEAELDLREIKPPFDSVKEDVARYLAATTKILNQKMADPDERERIESELVADLKTFQDEQDKSH